MFGKNLQKTKQLVFLSIFLLLAILTCSALSIPMMDEDVGEQIFHQGSWRNIQARFMWCMLVSRKIRG